MSALTEAELAVLDLRAQRLENKYAYGVDTFDIEYIRSIAVDDIKLTRLGGTKEGIENFLDLYRGTTGVGIEVSKHVITNVLTELNDDGSISIKAEFTATHVFADKINLTLGYYRDTAVDVDGELKLSHKNITVSRVISLPPSTAVATGLQPTAAPAHVPDPEPGSLEDIAADPTGGH